MNGHQVRDAIQWESVNDRTRRMRVPGGWIYETMHGYKRDTPAITYTQVFVPDPAVYQPERPV